MKTPDATRRSFLKTYAATALASAIPLRWGMAEEIPAGRKIKLRFAVASDLHYGQANTPFDQMTGELVTWMNKEKADKGLDALFINGDLTHDSSASLVTLRDKHLKTLSMPYYCGKGNHDFVDQTPGSPTESWEKIWGHPSNHTVKLGDMVFLIADTTAPAKADAYLAADHAWLQEQLLKHKDAPAVFVMIHIQQRKHKVDGWPEHGVKDEAQVPKAEAVMKLLETTPNVRAVFHGHNHLETSVYVSGERRYFFDSHLGGNWGAKRGYRIVEVYDDHSAVTYQVNGEQGGELNRHVCEAPKK
jgi:3',5'-cyclic AMP phosphodiesterase CpdA